MLEPLEFQYIWNREPHHRSFTLGELRNDVAQLSALILNRFQAEAPGLRLRRTTKFEWVAAEVQSWAIAPLSV